MSWNRAYLLGKLSNLNPTVFVLIILSILTMRKNLIGSYWSSQKIIDKKVKELWDKIDSNKWIKNISDLDIPLDILKLLALELKFNLECLNKKFLP